jgi:uncharacterized membrane protein YkvA (DUF1232 family)
MKKNSSEKDGAVEGLTSEEVEHLASVPGHFEKLKKDAGRVSDKDVEELLGRREELEKKIEEVPGRLKKFVNQVGLLFEMVGDYWNGKYREIPYGSIAMVVVSLVYFLSPIDLIPDFIPVIGYIDDALVVALTIKFIQDDLVAYCHFKGYVPEKYF